MARSLRDAADGSPRTTATSLRPPRVALATTLKPDSQMKPVFIPSAPGKLTSRLLWVRASDVAGVYAAAGAGLALGRGVRAIVLTNQNGAILELSGQQIGLMANADLSGLAITMN